MNTSSTAISDRRLGDSALGVAEHGAIAFGAILILVMYAAIFTAALLTLCLVEVRQANMVNFNALIAALEQRDRASDKETGLAAVVQRLREERRQYDYLAAHAPDCFPVSGLVVDEQNSQGGDSEAHGTKPISCDEVQNTAKNHANQLQMAEDADMFKLGNVDSYYLQ